MKNKNILATVLTKPNNLRVLMVISGLLLVLSLIGMLVTVPQPARVKQETTLVKYTQQGQFNYTVYLKPSNLYGPAPQTTPPSAYYPLAMVGNIDFAYHFQPAAGAAGTAWIEAVLENPGIWQKKLELVSSTATRGDFTLKFSLDMPAIAQLFSQIENEVGISPSSRRVTLNAYFESGATLQVQSLPLTLENNLIEIPNALSLTQDAGNGQFDYTVNTIAPVTPAPNATYPAAVVDSLDFTFTFVPATSDKVNASVQEILENPGIWQKTITLVSQETATGKISLHFPVSLAQFQQQFDEIDKETGLTTSSRLLTIQATVSSSTDSFVQSLPLTLSNDVLEVGGTLQEQQTSGTGSFDYVVDLKPNSIYDTTILKPPSVAATSVPPSIEINTKPIVTTPPAPVVLQPGQTAFVNLIDKMEVAFDYGFAADKTVANLKTSVDVVATLEATQAWSKSFTLLQADKSGNFILDFPVDITGYTTLLNAIRTETGVSADSYNLTVTATIHTTGTTSFGPIDETFSPAMKGTIKNNVLTWDKDLIARAAGALKSTTTVDNPKTYLGLSVAAAKAIFSILSFIFMCALCGLITIYVRHHGSAPSSFDREVQKIRKKYGARIAESVGLANTQDGKTVSLNSIEDLMKIADELGKPVVHQSGDLSQGVESHYVIDGDTRYQYSVPRNRSNR
jgi:hypothetical protein